MSELLIGCGSNWDKRVGTASSREEDPGWTDLTTCDINPEHNPDVVWDLNVTPWAPFEDNSYDEIHAYEVLEHLGQQGDYEALFAHFTEIWRILKPDGVLCATVPAWTSVWLWGDPSHRRAILPATLVFLQQAEYEKQVGVTAMSDFRHIYKADFEPVFMNVGGDTFTFILRAIKKETNG